MNLGEWNLTNGTFEIQIVDKLNDASLTKNWIIDGTNKSAMLKMRLQRYSEYEWEYLLFPNFYFKGIDEEASLYRSKVQTKNNLCFLSKCLLEGIDKLIVVW